MKNSLLLSFAFLLCLFSQAQQKGIIYGTVKDPTTNEPLIGASVTIAPGVGMSTDIDGNFSIEASYGKYTLSITYIGYIEQKKEIELNTPKLNAGEILLESETLNEVVVTADVARDRETPVAFTTVEPKKIQEELASQDLPMVLNRTPGVYATQQGGGDGDARISIRGFNQRFVGVMLDGVPVNDMENGWVYWSNWFGLDVVTRSIQVQRGLGASKLALPSVGGTINILTKGIDAKPGVTVKQEAGTAGFLRTSVGLTSGKLKNGWGVTAAGSFKTKPGWSQDKLNSDMWLSDFGTFEMSYSQGWFYFLKVEKKLNKHLLSLAGYGAPQQHAQRPFKKAISYFDSEYAYNLGIDTTGAENNGLNFNEHYGYLYRTTNKDDTAGLKKEVVYERLNYFHKPQFYLRDFWTISEKLVLSTTAYVSIGNGGGTSGGTSSSSSLSTNDYTPDGHIDFQELYNNNKFGMFSIDPLYSLTERKASKFLRSSVNNHRWAGIISSATWNYSEYLNISGGIDLRDYKGEHYRKVYDLLGGDYSLDDEDQNASSKMRRKNEKIGYNYDGFVRWAGFFGQAEYKKGVWSAFISVSGVYQGYKRVDYFKNKDLVIGDNVYAQAVGYGDVFYYTENNTHVALPGAIVTTSGDTTYINNSGVVNDGYVVGAVSKYTIESPEARYSQSDWKWLPGYTAKGGANYNVNEFHSVYVNTGYLSRTPRFINVIDQNNKVLKNIENEKIIAFEIGHAIRKKKIATNLNVYYTRWKNRPVESGINGGLQVNIGDEIFYANINGIDALHMGAELDFAWLPIEKLEIEGSFSYGDWTWQSGDSAVVTDENGNTVYDPDNAGQPMIIDFDATGVHVGDAAQTQVAGSVRYEFIKDAYFKIRYTYFERQYADFQPTDLTGDDKRRESWKTPAYGITELHLGYNFKIEKVRFDIRGSVLNVLDVKYISDARNNDSFANTSDFDANSAAVFFGLGRRYNISLQISF